jgi:hypothetical protein
MSRERLPNRRPSLTEDIGVGDRVYSATIGFDRFCRPKEIFLAGAREGSDMQAVLDDTAIVVSLALQNGIPAAALRMSMSRAPLPHSGAPRAPASVIGAAIDFIARLEIEASI